MGRLVFGVLLLAVVAAAALGVAAWWWVNQPLPLAAERVEVSIEPGTPPREVAQAWVAAGVRTPPRLLYEWFRWSGDARRIRAGSYEIEAGVTPRELLRKMVQGDEAMESVRFVEGWTFRQLRAELARAPSLRPTTASLTDAQLMAAIGAPGVAPEGRFFPDTYVYSRGVSDVTVLRRAYTMMHRRLAAAWDERAPDTPLKSPDEALILASIVEKETGRNDERTRVAAVFVNRLRQGMRLQSDPTILYGLFQGQVAWGRPIYRSEIQQRTAHNTYQIDGLPPTPICNPGRAAILATLAPAKTSDLYFVADGQGGHVFSTTLKDHNAAVQTWRKTEKEIRAKEAATAAQPAAQGPRAVVRPVPQQGQTQEPASPAPAAAAPAEKSADKPATEGVSAAAAAAAGAAAVGAAAAAVPLPTRKPKR